MKRITNFGANTIIPKLHIQQRHYVSKHNFWGFLSAINTRNFTAAEEIFSAGQNALKNGTHLSEESPESYTPINTLHDFSEMYPTMNCSKTYSDEKIEDLQDAAEQSANLLKNIKLCAILLQQLDAQIQKHTHIKNWHPEEITPGDPIQFNAHYTLPAARPWLFEPVTDNENLHLFLMNEQLKKDGIDTQNEQYRFFGYIDPSDANKIIRSGALFSEEVALGSLLIHGVDAHYFQWYLLSMGIEKGALTFKNNLKLRELLTASIELRCTISNLSLWDKLMDFSPQDYEPTESRVHFGFRAPYYLTEWLLLNPTLPHLRGLMLNQWYANIIRIQALYLHKYTGKPIPYHLLVGAHAASGNNPAAISYFKKNDLFAFSPLMTKQLKKSRIKNVYYQDKHSLFKSANALHKQILETEKKSTQKLCSQEEQLKAVPVTNH